MNTLIALMISGALIWGNATHAPDDNGTITVAPNEVIEIRDTQCGITATTTTDSTGMFGVTVPAGTYFVMPQNPEAITNMFIVDVADNCTMEILK